MVWSGEVGLISTSEDLIKRFWWTLPNYFAHYTESLAPLVVCSPLFSSYSIRWRLVLIRDESSVGLFLWKTEGNYHCLSDLSVKLGMKHSKYELLEKTITGELNSYGCFGEWDFERYHILRTKREEVAADGFLRFFCEMRLKTESPCEAPPNSKFILIITILSIFMLYCDFYHPSLF